MKLRRTDLIYPELSYKILGCAFNVHNKLGGGLPEKYYQKALAEAFRKANLEFKAQVYHPLYYENKIIGKVFFDFLVEEKIVVEIKQGNRYFIKNMNQVMEYLKVGKFQLAILINFRNENVNFKRVINLNQ